MKYVKMLGLAAVAAMALMAFLGAGSASATVLCKSAPSGGVCPAGETYGSGTKLSASLDSGSSATLTDTSGSVLEDTCTASTVGGEITNAGGSGKVVSGPVSTLTFTNCSNTTTVLEQTGTLEVSYISGTSNGTVTGKGFRVTVLTGVSCVYTAGAGTDLGTLTGGAEGTMDIHAVVQKKEGSFLCPNDAVWDAKYTVTNPKPLYVADH